MIYSHFLPCDCLMAVASIIQNEHSFFASKSEGRFNFTTKSLSLLTVHEKTRCKFREK